MCRTLIACLVAALALAPGAQAWSWPTEGPVLRPFLFGGEDPQAPGQHRGIDVSGADGEAVHAPAAGVVSFAGTVPAGGRTLTIRTAEGYAVTLLHLGRSASRAARRSPREQSSGTVGSSGAPEVDAPYVHLGIRVGDQEDGYLDPVTFLPPRLAVVPPVEPPPPTDPPPVADPVPPVGEPAPPAPEPVEPPPSTPAPPSGGTPPGGSGPGRARSACRPSGHKPRRAACG